ncbi:MAG TPA: RNA 2',3'-cyclic phosphodiesterase [Nitrososphaera sp.]|nr:RNA 2',3'-cyclic phosphodiesterase [Nitrososphaera sp.]
MRTFIAVDVSTGAIARLQNEIMVAGWSPKDIKPVEASNFHFTLIFLGEKSDNDVDSIKAKMAQVQFEPFPLTYTGVGAFPKPASSRVVWVGVDQVGGEKLTALANDVVAKMAELGFSADKPFSPHLTIFRARGRPFQTIDISAKYQGRTFGSDLIDRVHLKKSDLAPSGPVYSNIYTVEAKK